jgi:hypothetical protein
MFVLLGSGLLHYTGPDAAAMQTLITFTMGPTTDNGTPVPVYVVTP